MRGFALVNCTIYSPAEKYEALVVLRNKVLKVGAEKEILKTAKSLNLKTYDLNGATVVPGFIDAHLHLAGLGFSLAQLDLRNITSIEELKKVVAEEASRKSPGAWILGRGWDQEKFAEKRFPTRWDLDEAAPRNPVFLKRVCGHVAVANSLALKAAGISKKTPDPPGGVIDRDDKGEPTGILRESALEYIYRVIAQKPEEYLDAIKKASHKLLSEGVTCVAAVSCDFYELKALFQLSRKGEIPLKVRAYVNYSVFIKLKDIVPPDISLGPVSLAGVKLLLDGSLGGRTAYLKEPYSDDPSTRGVLLISENKLKEILRDISHYGWQPAVHTIGDAALEIYLNSLKMLSFSRPRVEHASLTPPELLDLMSELKVLPVVQPHFIISDFWVVERLGERAKYVYAFKSMIKRGLKIAFSTDAPVEPSNPLQTVEAAVTRGEGLVELAEVTPYEKLSVNEALNAYTVGSAYACRLENSCGRIKEGFSADLIILDKDPHKVNPGEISSLKVLATIVDGKVVYGTLNLRKTSE
mgnify:CR=1 FL=1